MRRMLVLISCLAIIPTFSQGQERATKSGGARVVMDLETSKTHGASESMRPTSSPGQAATVVRNGAGATRVTTPSRRAMGTTNTAGAAAAIGSTRNVQTRPTSNMGIMNGGPRLAADDRNPDFTPVPGLGFDYPHLAATRGAGAVNEGGNNQGFVTFVPIFDSAILLPGVSEVVPDTVVDQIPQARSSEPSDVEERVRRERTEETPRATAPIADAAPAREVDDYLFVRRDGTIFFAVAYTWDNETLRYITREGMRRSIARAVLDLDATQQFNEQRGTNFLPMP